MPMGSGKGDVDIYVAQLESEESYLSLIFLENNEQVITSAAKKLPIKAEICS